MTACHVVTYRELSADEITRDLFTSFIRRQVVTDCWRKVDGKWVVRADPFVDDWSEEDYQTLIACLRNTVATGGFVCGAFVDGVLKGFVSVESELFGARREYLDLSSLHVLARTCAATASGGSCSGAPGTGRAGGVPPS